MEASLLKNGQIEDITTHDGMVLNGNHRYRLLIKNGIEPRLKPFIPNGVETPEDFVQAHLEGRHMTFGQRVCVAVMLAKAKKKDPLENLKLSGRRNGESSIIIKSDKIKNEANNKTINKVAESMNLGSNVVIKAAVLFNNDKELFDKVYHGKCSVQAAYMEYRRNVGGKIRPTTKTTINLKAFKTEIKIPSCFCSLEELEVFRKTMNANGWILEMKSSDGEIRANWYGNGHSSVGSNWGVLKPEFDLRRALIVAANDKRDKLK